MIEPVSSSLEKSARGRAGSKQPGSACRWSPRRPRRGEWSSHGIAGQAPADRLAVAVLAFGVALRIWGAWVSRCITEPDPTVVALMARHMAALKEFPVFFYGQAYMGSLEPMASALMVRLLGATGFAVNLGPVLFSALALFFLWRWARDAAGSWGGLAAVLAAGVGPSVYFQFQMASRGGYMVALWVNAASLCLAARIAADLRDGQKVSWIRYLLLGLVAGLGLWSNWIVVPALAVAALLIIHGMRWTFWRHPAGIAAGLAGTVIGMLPWWIYNLRHGWASLEMSQIGGHAPLREALLNSWNRFLVLQMPGRFPPGAWLPGLLAVGVLAVALAGGILVLRRFRGASLRTNYARAAALLFCVLFVWVFVTSGFTRTRTARYWVPLVPGLAVLAAVACAAPGRRGRQAAAWTLLGALAVTQTVQSVSQMAEAGRRVEDCQAAFREIDAALESTGADALLAPLQLYSLNVALDERIPVSDGKQEFYKPILRQVELAENPAYASGYYGIGTFLRQQGATWKTIRAAYRAIVWKVNRPQLPLREIPSSDIIRLADRDGTDRTDLTDHNLDTWWSPGAVEDASLEWTFDRPQDLRSVYLLFAHGMAAEAFGFPRGIRIEVKVDGQWKTVLADDPIVPLEWSGNRVFFPSGLARLEYRMNEKSVEGLRVTLLGTQARARRMGWRLAEAAVLALDLSDLSATTIDSGTENIVQSDFTAAVYTPRWFACDLLRRNIAAEDRLAGLAPRVFGRTEDLPRDGSVDLDRNTMIFAEPPFADGTRRTLDLHARAWQEATTGYWTVFTVTAGDWDAGGQSLPPAVVWTGDALMTGNADVRASEALRRLRTFGGSIENQRALLGEIVKWRPALLSALSEKETRGLGGEAAVQVRANAASVPPAPCATEFANGIRLDGIAVEPSEVSGAGEVAVRLYWSAMDDCNPDRELVFIHLRDKAGKIVAQDDYRGSPLLWGPPAVRPVPGEIVAETRRILLPEGIAPGPLAVAVGLYSPQNGRRVKIRRTEAPHVRRRAATWPDQVRVVH